MAKNTVKRGRLSKAEEYYIQGNRLSKTPVEIASDLGRSESVVKKAIENLPIVDTVNPPPNAVEDTKPEENLVKVPNPGDDAREAIAQVYKGVNMKDSVKRARVKHKGRKTGIVMTEEISGKSDVRDKGLKSGSRMTEDSIFKPHGEEGDYDE